MATFQKDGLWVQGGVGALSGVSEDTPFVPGQVGRVMSVRSTDGKVPRFYQYVQRYATETSPAKAGGTAFWQDIDDFVVTPDSARSIGGTTSPTIAGVFLGTSPAAGKYGFIQVAGIASAAITGTNLAGTPVVASGTVGNLTAAATDQTRKERIVGLILAATTTATGTTFDVLLDIPRVGW
jgi:hypothetical protein